MRRITKKVYYRFLFRLTSPLCLGSGENNETDKDLIRNGRGEPYIPASSIAGVIRALYRNSRSDTDLNEQDYFGYVKINKKAGKMDGNSSGESRIIFSDAQMSGSWREHYYVSVRDSVALDEYKTAIPGAKFDMEVLEPGLKEEDVFETWIEQNYYGDPGEKDILKQISIEWFKDKVRFGGKTSRGYGEVCLLEVKKRCFALDKEHIADWLSFDPFSEGAWEKAELVTDNSLTAVGLSLKLQQSGGISIRKYTTRIAKDKDSFPDYEQLTLHAPNDDEERPVIPGTSWAGAFRRRMTELVPECGKSSIWGMATKDLKKKSSICFSETQLKGAKPKTISRNAIDRFSGGTVKKALFTEKTWYGGEAQLRISFLESPSQIFVKALGAAICDLHFGLLTVGGLSAIGRGGFRILEINGKKIPKEIQADELYKEIIEILDNMEVL